MVNSLLLLVCAASLIIWLLQEAVARGQVQQTAQRQLNGQGSVPAALEPDWSRWAYKLVAAAWLAWLLIAVMVKDGDFAFVLVMLTLLAGIIAGLDYFWFQRRRERFASDQLKGGDADNVAVDAASEFEIAEYARSFFPVLVVVLVLRSFVVEPFQIPSSSMVPTLQVGDYILVNKFSYGLRLPVVGTKFLEVGEPRRGDVMVFFPPDDPRYFIKRVIGLPGDELVYKDRVLYINGEQASQELLALLPPERPAVALLTEQLGEAKHLVHNSVRSAATDFAVTVEPGHYFMMGDNRDNSADSRVWGQVPERNIVGKAFAVWMHWRSFSQLPSFDRVGTIR